MSHAKRPDPRIEETRLSVRAVLRVILVVLATAGVLWLVYTLRGVIMLLTLALFFAYMLAPIVRFIRQPVRIAGRRVMLPSAAAIAVVYLLVFVTLVVAARLVGPSLSLQLTQFSKQAPDYLAELHAKMEHLGELASGYDLPPEAQSAIDKASSNALQSVSDAAQNLALWLLASLTYVPWLVLVPILGFFLLKDGESFRRWAIGVMPAGPWRRSAARILRGVDVTIASYIRAQLIACLLIGVVCMAGFSIIGVPFALVLGALAALLEFIPLVGPLTIAVVVTTVAGFSSFHTAVVVVGFLLLLRLVEDYVVYPRIIGHGTHLNPLTVILAVLCGAEIAGIAGVFFAVPAAGILSVLIAEVGGTDEIIADILEPAPPTDAAGMHETFEERPSLPKT